MALITKKRKKGVKRYIRENEEDVYINWGITCM